MNKFIRTATLFFGILLCLSASPLCIITVKAQDNTPMFIRSGTTTDPATMKTITWMTDPTDTPRAVMKVAKKSDGAGSFKDFAGKTMNIEYDTWYLGSGTNPKIPKIGNSVTLEGLEPGTTYIYQVGDGTNWSNTMEFTTTTVTKKYSFNVLPDVQVTNHNATFDFGSTAWLKTIASTYINPGTRPMFTIQVGDLVDREHVYLYYRLFGELCEQFPGFANTDLVFAIGNHEYYRGINTANNTPALATTGEGRGEIAKFLNGIPPTNNSLAVGSGTYCVDYANMRVIALDFVGRSVSGMNSTQLIDAQAEWLRENLSNCDKRWKVVSLHYPIFHDTPADNPYPRFESVLAPIFEEFGVHLVFSGHTHYTRRVQVKNGVRISEGMNSTAHPNAPIYITCGNLNNNLTPSNLDHSVYIRGDVDGSTMTVTMYRYGATSGTVRDRFTITQTVPVASIQVSGANGVTAITTDGGTLQIQAVVLPADVDNNTVTWSITSAAGIASISEGGLLTAAANGTVIVRATANDGSGVRGEATIAISGQRVPVSTVTVSGEGGATAITTDGGELQMQASILPNDATNKTVTWSITPATGVASISEGGLLTAAANGTVTVRATANDGTGMYGEATITISGQHVFVSSVTVSDEEDATAITTLEGTLQMQAIVLPEDATNKTVTWSITPATGVASISEGGLLTATANGTVIVRATANDGSRVYGEATVSISGQRVFVSSIKVSGTGNATAITADGGTLQMQTLVLPNDATNKTVAWSIIPTIGVASISEDGMLTAKGNGTVVVFATANDGSGVFGEADINISGQVTTNIEVPFAPNLKIYPNPFTNVLHITGAENCTLRVMDAAGATIHIQKITNANENIRLEQLSAGVYFFHLEKDEQKIIVKVVKD